MSRSATLHQRGWPQGIARQDGGSETFTIRNDMVYLHAPDGFGTSKFAAGLEKGAGVPMTVRNWRTIEALWQMANAVK